MPDGIVDFLRGGTMVALLGAAIYFLRFWKDTSDRLFLLFSLAFFILSASQIIVFAMGKTGDSSPEVYWLRLVAFLLIIAGIVEKNLPGQKGNKGDEEMRES